MEEAKSLSTSVLSAPGVIPVYLYHIVCMFSLEYCLILQIIAYVWFFFVISIDKTIIVIVYIFKYVLRFDLLKC